MPAGRGQSPPWGSSAARTGWGPRRRCRRGGRQSPRGDRGSENGGWDPLWDRAQRDGVGPVGSARRWVSDFPRGCRTGWCVVTCSRPVPVTETGVTRSARGHGPTAAAPLRDRAASKPGSAMAVSRKCSRIGGGAARFRNGRQAGNPCPCSRRDPGGLSCERGGVPATRMSPDGWNIVHPPPRRSTRISSWAIYSDWCTALH